MKLKSYFLTAVMTLSVPINCLAWGIASWDKNLEDRLSYYRAYICSDYDRARQKSANIATITIPDVNQPSFCCDVPDHLLFVYFAVVAVDNSNEESDPAIGWVLLGDIYNTFNDGAPHTAARVDGLDLSTLGIYFAYVLPTSHQQIDCDTYFTVQGATLAQRCDLNGSGRVDGFDLIELGLKFGNRAY